jgi:hypothetical protein
MAPSNQQTTRQFATSSRVFPPYLPYLQTTRTPKAAKLYVDGLFSLDCQALLADKVNRLFLRRIPSAVALAGIGEDQTTQTTTPSSRQTDKRTVH